MTDLFSTPDKHACLAYKNLYFTNDSCWVKVREAIEALWERFCPYADDNFRKEFSKKNDTFHQRLFEMYLTVSLLERDFDVQSQKRRKEKEIQGGPDILINLGCCRLWIEATCATQGEGEDKVPRSEPGKANLVDLKQAVLRVRFSLDQKEKKFRKYMRNRIVSQNDFAIIAINTCQISESSIEPLTDEYMLGALYGVGHVALIDKESGKGKIKRAKIRENIKKAKGALISVTPFLNHSMNHISAALGFYSSMWHVSQADRLGDDCYQYPNLLCSNPWPKKTLPIGQEWVFEKSEDGWAGTLVDNTGQNEKQAG